MPPRVRSERTSLSNCAKAASTPSINFPVDVSSIGSVAERREIPSDFRNARSAKWSYFSRANRVRLYTTTKWTLRLFHLQYKPLYEAIGEATRHVGVGACDARTHHLACLDEWV